MTHPFSAHRPAPTLSIGPIAAAMMLAGICAPGPAPAQIEELDCEAQRPAKLLPTDPGRCAELAPVVRDPSGLPLDEYETALGEFLRKFCHRDRAAGWKRDKRVRDTGPYTASLQDGEWVGSYHGTHAPVVIWYSEEMLDWMAANRPPDGSGPADAPPIPDGAILVKEMFPQPAAACDDIEPEFLLPTNGAAVMVRQNGASHDGWFWGWFGWSGWDPDWPPGPSNRLPYMGFGQYCVNCHASAENNLTFSSLRNVEGEEGEPLVFLSQHFFDARPLPSHHRLVSLPTDDAPRLGEPLYVSNPSFTESVRADSLPKVGWDSVVRMPSETYDNVWVAAGPLTAESQFVTSDQCIGCHDAGGTGLQFDMTVPNPHAEGETGALLNYSPYATWRTSPMGLGGRDPIFFAQLASETETFHPEAAAIVENTCLGCHGILGQRQFAIDQPEVAEGARPSGSGYARDEDPDDECEPFLRSYVSAVPYPAGNPSSHLADYGALARDGISCTACHRMLVGEGGGPALDLPENRCVEERQEFLNPDNEGFARTFTGSFLVGPPDELIGPFESPKTLPMEHALGIEPVADSSIQASELCGSCHTVHLPVMRDAQVLAYTYEQTTYPEWAMSAYRTGTTPQGPLPEGPGALAESCQSCHMASKTREGEPLRSKIASIQEFSNFPEAEYNLGPEDIDLEVRENFARHTLVGLNVFFVEMAQQFPDVLGIRTQDPMLVSKGLDPLLLTEQAMLDQASYDTARVTVDSLATEAGTLRAKVTVESQVGHKFPSGVGFRRAFLRFSVYDAAGNELWVSGRTDGAGVIVDRDGNPVAGELWWEDDCSTRRHGGEPRFQPHFTRITSEDQVQIYQELVTSPAPVEDPRCGEHPVPGGQLTTSFLSICGHLKDNRILPHGFLPLDKRIEIAEALGAGEDLARDTGPKAVGDDPDYVEGGRDSLVYEVDLGGLDAEPAAVEATLFYQAIPPFYLQDRFCTSTSDDTQRLYFLASHLNLQGTAAEGWKLQVVGSGQVPVPGP
ncbi:MAG: hypothetical protein MI919_23805 [Holophagales bacterium]|nr:hypothetical protein [Holophagales bacterium]